MNATASLIGAVGDRPLTGKHLSEAVRDYWSLVLPLQKAMYNCCLAFMKGNAADAEDAVQDVLIHGSKKYPDYAGKIKNFSAWMLRVTKNFCITLIKKRAKHATGVDDIELVSALGAVDRDSAANTPVDWLLSDEESALIDDAIASLPDTLRGTYSLHFYEGLNPHQIADRQGITKVNVYQRISRALNVLAPQLIGYFRSDNETTGSVPLTKASKSIACSAGSTTRTPKTGCQSPELVPMDAVAAEKQPLGEKIPQEREPLNICEEAHLSGSRPAHPDEKCLKLAEVAPPPKKFKIQNSKFKIGTVPENEARSHGSNGQDTARPMITTDRDRARESIKQFTIPNSQLKIGTGPENEARSHGSNGQDTARPMITTDRDRARESIKQFTIPNSQLKIGTGPENEARSGGSNGQDTARQMTATARARERIKQFQFPNSQLKIGNVPENEARSGGGNGLVTERQQTATARGRESPKIIPRTWLLRGYRALTNLAKWLSGYFGDDSETIENKQFLIPYSQFKIGKVPENQARARGGHGLGVWSKPVYRFRAIPAVTTYCRGSAFGRQIMT